MKNIIQTLGLTVTVSLMSCTAEKTDTIKWVSSTESIPWKISNISASNAETNASSISIKLDEEQQTIDGFGGCFNELGWEAIQSLDEMKQETIYSALFDSLKGCRFNLFRMPIGANDYAVDWYSHNETPDDFSMENFSIERDQKRLIPYIKKAQSYDPDLQIWASPWCPPSWMKTNKHYACSPAEVNDLDPKGKGEEMVTQFIMEEDYLSSYASYFSKFIQAYKAEDIDIYAVHVQNEPNSCQTFPSCVWHPDDLAIFIGDYLGPTLKEEVPGTELWLGTVERPHIERVDAIVNDPEAGAYVKGVGFQWAGKGAIPMVHQKYPNLQLMQTETECGDGSNDWAAAEYTFNLMKHYLNNGANSYLYWNMVLNETGKSQWGWKQNSMISIDTKTQAYTFNPEYYLMKHFSYFIEPGAKKLASTDENCLAFKKDGQLVIEYYNAGQATTKVFEMGSQVFEINLEEKSFNTFIVTL